ncbi:methylated-DNA--[protein]-cysteine S-methyltransferase [Tichowtungia aerotolerans]|uniref:methylated-DNA--[protein]-cysteine S-methyltransferase n=1 Tax=Tichowtungia aerotolerans TaxID=2697043 RepID=A0A6P1MAW3_9BACT|nr:methylated-DNA--[protein]-cysteine S-methyltransferase [Tichowtungia aerotolerans]QHI69238.1 methylated-DNA--[protein]-cysteine S-methyltransferase [Tichowtungia aerotolerans]
MKVQTTWGTITLTTDRAKIVGCSLPSLNKTPTKPFKGRVSKDWKNADEFFQGLKKEFPVIETPPGTDFQQAVWKAMQKIPRGKTRTYSEIAAAIGRPKAVRAVGTACGANPLPLFIPCHRVVAKNGLGGFGSGLPWKKMLLKSENAL